MRQRAKKYLGLDKRLATQNADTTLASWLPVEYITGVNHNLIGLRRILTENVAMNIWRIK